MASSGATVEALESLYRADLSRFVRTAGAIVGDEAAGCDAVQEAFAQAVRKRASFKGDAPFEAWVWRIVINDALMLRRRRAPELLWDPATLTTPSTNHVPEQDATVRAWVWPPFPSASGSRSFSATSRISTTGRSRPLWRSRSEPFRPRSPRRTLRYGAPTRRQCDERRRAGSRGIVRTGLPGAGCRRRLG